jgi:hypothetical protein
MSHRIWTSDEICDSPESGDWFFGIVNHEGRYRIAEIFLGYGYVPISAPHPWWHPQSWWWLLRDIYQTPARKLATLDQPE